MYKLVREGSGQLVHGLASGLRHHLRCVDHVLRGICLQVPMTAHRRQREAGRPEMWRQWQQTGLRQLH